MLKYDLESTHIVILRLKNVLQRQFSKYLFSFFEIPANSEPRTVLILEPRIAQFMISIDLKYI